LVAEDPSIQPGPFNVKTIEFLVALMSKHDISEIDLSEGEQRVRLRRGNRVVAAAAPALVQAPPPSSSVPPPIPSVAIPEKVEKVSRNLIEIKSPAIGTFYPREKPDSPQPYVSVGSRVTPTTTVGQIEAMKVFSEIPAGCSGVIEEILVENGHAVEYNQVLFRVDPSR
jgi:acetyl-CoA carboxylase biotin carboxyl carrier protein